MMMLEPQPKSSTLRLAFHWDERPDYLPLAVVKCTALAQFDKISGAHEEHSVCKGGKTV